MISLFPQLQIKPPDAKKSLTYKHKRPDCEPLIHMDEQLLTQRVSLISLGRLMQLSHPQWYYGVHKLALKAKSYPSGERKYRRYFFPIQQKERQCSSK